MKAGHIEGRTSSWRILHQLLPFLRPYRSQAALAALALLLAAGATLLMPLMFRRLVDDGFTALQAGVDATGQNRIDGLFLGLFGLALLLAIGTSLRYYLVSWLGDRLTSDLRKAIYTRVLLQDPEFFETLRPGEVLSRLAADTTLVQTLVGSSLSLGLRHALLFCGALLMMLATSLRLASVIVALLLIVAIPIIVFGRHVRRLSRTSQDRLADTGALAGETLNSVTTVQSYVRESMESGRYDRSVDQAFDSAVRRNRSRSILTLVAITLVFGAIVIVLWLGAQAVISGRMSGGTLLQFMLYAAMVAGSTAVLSEVLGDVQRAAGATERLLELLEAKPRLRSVPDKPVSEVHRVSCESTDSGGPDGLGGTDGSDESRRAAPIANSCALASTVSGVSVRFDKVDFHYPSRPDAAAIRDLQFEVSAGETVALVGPSGAGKTTVLQLLLRFYDVHQGRILINDADIRMRPLEHLRESIGFVSQESIVFSDTIEANIRYGRLDATEQDIRVAADQAQALEFIERLPEGFDSHVGERGVRLSGGQRQRLSIARALLKNPPLMLLDEATSSLDTESEQKVQLALDQAMTGRTTLVIAHRLSTIVNADRILVLDAGRLVEVGTHETLMAAEGLYARLASMQFTTG